MKIGKHDTKKEVMIIAEIGNNHEGDFGLAKEMVAAANQAGANAVKFQHMVPERIVARTEIARQEQYRRFQLTFEQYRELAVLADGLGLVFLCTLFDTESVSQFEPILPAFKIASGDNDFFPLLGAVADKGKPILLATGLADHQVIAQAIGFIGRRFSSGTDFSLGSEAVKEKLALLHCVANYPVQPKDASLSEITYLERLFKPAEIGLSDHTVGPLAAVLAVALGARIIEKHFTLDHLLFDKSRYRDHQLSADPAEMTELIGQVRQAEKMLGLKGNPLPDEENRVNIRRSVAAKHDMVAGQMIRATEVAGLRPGKGIPFTDLDLIAGKLLKRPIKRGELILSEDLTEEWLI